MRRRSASRRQVLQHSRSSCCLLPHAAANATSLSTIGIIITMLRLVGLTLEAEEEEEKEEEEAAAAEEEEEAEEAEEVEEAEEAKEAAAEEEEELDQEICI